MERISREDLELLHGKMIAEKELTILGFKNKLNFENLENTNRKEK